MRRVRVGLAQVNPTVGAIEANARLVADWMGRARAAGCDVVAFPELTLTGYPPEDLLLRPRFIEDNRRAPALASAVAWKLPNAPQPTIKARDCRSLLWPSLPIPLNKICRL